MFSRLLGRIPSSFFAGCLVVVLVGGCAYARRSTTVHPVEVTREALDEAPDHLWTVTIVSAELPTTMRTGLPWDSDGSGPDPFVRLYVNDRKVWESAVVENANMPEWNVTLPHNLQIGPNDALRIEIWDRDQAGQGDPMGVVRHTGLPGNALPDAVARVATDVPGAVLTMVVTHPKAHRGTGIKLYEQRSDALLVVDVHEMSPASRAGIVAGDRIMAIAGQAVADLGDKAIGMLSMAAARGSALTIQDAQGVERTVELDRGYIWITM